MNFEYVDEFWIKKLVFINSGGSANVVLPMSVMGLLLGRNNVGKTSGISALKLFLLPETNFKDCRSKFGFASNGGYHDGPESWNFYFPSERSFIICEAENIKGNFCMVLHRAINEEFGYSRIVVPVKYEQIQHLFWDFDPKYNSGFGKNLEDLSLKSVREGLKPFKPQLLTKADEIKEAIYSRPGSVDDLSRFCLLPLPQKGDRREVEAIRSLLNLAFRISGVDKLAGAVASIIETQNSGKEGRLSVDVLSINREYEQLKQDAEHLRKVSIHQSIWTQLKESYLTYIQDRNVVKHIGQEILITSESLLSQIQEQKKRLQHVLEDAIKNKTDRQQTEVSLRRQLDTNKGVLREKVSNLQRFHDQIKLADQYWATYSPIGGINDKQDLAKYLDEQLSILESDIAASENPEMSKQKLFELDESRRKISDEIRELNHLISNDKICTLQNLEQHPRSLLHSLNTSFDHITADLTQEHKSIINSFSSLFDYDLGDIYFLQQKLTGTVYELFDPERVRRERQNSLVLKQKDHAVILERIKKISDSPKEKEINAFRKQRDEMRDAIRYLRSYDGTKDHIHELTQQIETLNLDISKDEESHNSSIKALEICELEVSRFRSELNVAESKLGDLITQEKIFRGATAELKREFTDPFLADFNPTQDSISTNQKFELLVSSFVDRCTSLNQTKRVLFTHLNTLLNESLLPGQASLAHAIGITFDNVRTVYEDLRAIFDNYDSNLKKHHADIESHNNQTGVRSAAITEIGKLIDSFRRSINTELSSIKISNLESVEIIIEVDERFSSLRDDMESVNFSGNQLLSERIYNRLNSFCDDFFKGQQGGGKRLQLDRIITGVRYKINKDGRSTSSQQSTGTNSMINTVLLALLLKSMVPANIRLHFPIVFDEVLNLDSVNLKTIKRVVDDHHFVLFVVCPNNAGIVADAIPNWYDLSLHSLTEGIMLDQCKVLHFGMTERLTDEPMMV